MYESPIELIFSEFQDMIINQTEHQTLKAIQRIGVNVDKNELLKALAYDRGQYQKGFKDGMKIFIEEYRNQIKTYTGMFTDDDFYISLRACLSAIDFIKFKLLGEENNE